MTDQTAPAPRRGRGRPRKLDPDARRTTVRFPPDLLAEMSAAAEAEGRSLNDEIIARCCTRVATLAAEAKVPLHFLEPPTQTKEQP